MCNFFSFISDGSGNFFYFNAKKRNTKTLQKKYESFDSHTSIADHFFKSPTADDKCNKYEYSTDNGFVVDQINVADDSDAAKSWVEGFVQTNEFQELCLAAVKQDGDALQFVKNQTPAICLAAVKQSGYALQFVKNQTPAICLAAVKQYGWSLQFVKNQTPAICLAAVKQDGRALRFVKNQTPAICLAAVKQSGYALQFVKPKFRHLFK